jgi:hypothetical protein
MSWVIPGTILGVLTGFALGVLDSFSLVLLGLDGSGFPSLAMGLVGAVAVGVVGAYFDGPPSPGRVVARWCVLTAAVVGSMSFLAGFVGPLLFQPDSPQGPLLGILFTGPLRALAGAVLGVILGLVAYATRPASAKPRPPAE